MRTRGSCCAWVPAPGHSAACCSVSSNTASRLLNSAASATVAVAVRTSKVACQHTQPHCRMSVEARNLGNWSRTDVAVAFPLRLKSVPGLCPRAFLALSTRHKPACVLLHRLQKQAPLLRVSYSFACPPLRMSASETLLLAGLLLGFGVSLNVLRQSTADEDADLGAMEKALFLHSQARKSWVD